MVAYLIKLMSSIMLKKMFKNCVNYEEKVWIHFNYIKKVTKP